MANKSVLNSTSDNCSVASHNSSNHITTTMDTTFAFVTQQQQQQQQQQQKPQQSLQPSTASPIIVSATIVSDTATKLFADVDNNSLIATTTVATTSATSATVPITSVTTTTAAAITATSSGTALVVSSPDSAVSTTSSITTLAAKSSATIASNSSSQDFGTLFKLTLPTITLSDLSLDIKTKSIESTLITLVTQITTLVNARDKPIKTEKQLRAIVRVGQAVNLAVDRFVAVGEAIADDNPEIRSEMYDACKDSRSAGTMIEQLCDSNHESSPQSNMAMKSYADRSGMVRAARALLSSVTRVLLIADTVVVKQLISAKDRVSISLNRLENVANFTEFVKAFSQFGTEMVELAHLTGDRQNDLKDERRRAQMSAARQILERSTMMLLTSSKTCLRHQDCDTARENRDIVFLQMRRAMDIIHMVVKEGVIPQLAASAACYETTHSRKHHQIRHGHHVSRFAAASGYQTPEWKLEEWDECMTAYNAIRRFQELLEMSRMTLVATTTIRDRLISAFDAVVERTQDFTDSAYTSHEHREKILLLCDRAKLELNTLLRLGVCLVETASNSPTEDFEASIVQTLRASNDLKHELQDTALGQTDELFRTHSTGDLLLTKCKNAALAADHERLDEYAEQFGEYAEHVQEVCRLLHHVAFTEALQISSKNTETSLSVYGAQVVAACQTLVLHCSSKIAKENYEVFAEVYQFLVSDVSQLSRDVSELVRSGLPSLDNNATNNSSSMYMSLPPHKTTASAASTTGSTAGGKHQQQLLQQQSSAIATSSSTAGLAGSPNTPQLSASSQSLSATNATASQTNYNTTQSKCSSKQLELKGTVDDGLQQQIRSGSDMDDAEGGVGGSSGDGKWTDAEDNDIVRKGKSMSTMAVSMYQFTRGEGELKTTQDLFTQAEFFADEANKLYKIVRHFTYQVPSGQPKKELLDNIDKVPTFVQQLQFAVKNVTVGKAATFTKVDNVIQETKNLMGVISKVVSCCVSCANKYNVDMQGVLRARSRTLSPSYRGDNTGMYYDSGGAGGGAGMSKGLSSASEPDI